MAVAAAGASRSRSRLTQIARTGQAFPGQLISNEVASSRDLFANFERMRREIDELFGDVFERQTGLRGRGFSPSVDVFYVDDPPRAVVKADLAGVDIADVGARDPRPPAADRRRAPPGRRRRAASTSRSRSSTGPFRRLVELGAEVVADQARASYEDGILEVEIPLARPDETRAPRAHRRAGS